MYGERRRRRVHGDEHAIPTDRWLTESEPWEDEEAIADLEEGIEEWEEEDGELEERSESKQELPVYLVDGKPFPIKQQNKKPSFQESHTRITTYLENDVHAIVRILQKQREIESITLFINEAVKQYLKQQYIK